MVQEGTYRNFKTLFSIPEGFDENKKYPLVIFLHGAGTRSDNIEYLKKNTCFTNLRLHQDSRGFLLAAPLCHCHDWCEEMNSLIDWVAELRALPYVDTDRVYLTGNSMGGYGTWELSCIHPEWFAAIMPLCGGGCAAFCMRLKNVPVRAFHGLLDKLVDPLESLQMVKSVNCSGGHAELILFPHLAHNCWETVYTTEENYDWLLSHTLHSEKAEEEKLSGDIYG